MYYILLNKINNKILIYNIINIIIIHYALNFCLLLFVNILFETVNQ